MSLVRAMKSALSPVANASGLSSRDTNISNQALTFGTQSLAGLQKAGTQSRNSAKSIMPVVRGKLIDPKQSQIIVDEMAKLQRSEHQLSILKPHAIKGMAAWAKGEKHRAEIAIAASKAAGEVATVNSAAQLKMGQQLYADQINTRANQQLFGQGYSV